MKQLFSLLALMTLTLSVSAQQSWVNEVYNPQANTEGLAPMGARVISPEVHDNHTVTFRLFAPNARKVVVHGTMFTGGMEAKLHAAALATEAGIPMYIMNGHDPDILYRLLDGEAVGTYFAVRR